MTGGTYFVTAGSIPGWLWLASLPYALSVTTVLIGKHIDKYEQDGAAAFTRCRCCSARTSRCG